MNRRDVLAGTAALTAGALAAGVASPAFARPQRSLRERARDAWLYALPLIEMATIRSRTSGGRFNALGSVRTLRTAADRQVTAPNNDTLYSGAWLDLSAGPVVLDFAPGDRYQSVHVMNFYTDSDVVLSRRTLGAARGPFEIVGPGHKSRSANSLRVTTPYAWMIVRTLVDGPADLDAAHAAQDRVILTAPTSSTPPPPKTYADRAAPARAYFASAVDLMAQNPPPRADRAFLRSVGILDAAALARLTEAQWAEVEAGVTDAREVLTRVLTARTFVDGWARPPANIGLFGHDYVFRAVVALSGIGALTPSEAVYFTPEGDTGGPEFLGDGPFKLMIPPNYPADAFWSLTMYEVTPAKQRFLTPNAIDRYSIGDRTPGLVRNSDGSIDIWISRSTPTDAARLANWLPAPAKGPFVMTLRSYWPKPELINGRFRLPRVVAG